MRTHACQLIQCSLPQNVVFEVQGKKKGKSKKKNKKNKKSKKETKEQREKRLEKDRKKQEREKARDENKKHKEEFGKGKKAGFGGLYFIHMFMAICSQLVFLHCLMITTPSLKLSHHFCFGLCFYLKSSGCIIVHKRANPVSSLFHA